MNKETVLHIYNDISFGCRENESFRKMTGSGKERDSMRQGKPRKQFYFPAIVNIVANKNYLACKKKRANNKSCL